MTAFDYARSAATASRLLTRFGSAATLKRQTAGAYNPATAIAAVTVASVSTVAVVFDYPAKYVDGTLIKQGDRRSYLAPAVVPAQGDVLTWQGSDFTVVNVKPIAPAGTVVLYEAQLRG